MNACDFEFDNHCLSEYGFVICSFDGSGDKEVRSGGDITFNTVTMNHGKNYYLTDVSWKDCLEAEFDICKDPDKYSDSEMEITASEYRQIVRWLKQNDFKEMCFLYDAPGEPICYYNGSFNVSKIFVADTLYGLHLKMVTDSPYGHGIKLLQIQTVSADGKMLVLDHNDGTGHTYPDWVITCNSSGDLTIENEEMGYETVINNCTAGEVITIDGKHRLIATDDAEHKIYDDFNFEFPYIGNTIESRANTFTFGISCDVEVSYSPTIHDIP